MKNIFISIFTISLIMLSANPTLSAQEATVCSLESCPLLEELIYNHLAQEGTSCFEVRTTVPRKLSTSQTVEDNVVFIELLLPVNAPMHESESNEPDGQEDVFTIDVEGESIPVRWARLPLDQLLDVEVVHTTYPADAYPEWWELALVDRHETSSTSPGVLHVYDVTLKRGIPHSSAGYFDGRLLVATDFQRDQTTQRNSNGIAFETLVLQSENAVYERD